MTHCTSKSLRFSSLYGKKIGGSFTGGDISSDGGLLLLREVDKKLGITKKFSKAFNDQRHQGYISHSIHDLLKQRVYALAAGYEDVNDHDFLRNDLCFQTKVGREVNLASGSTLSRFENAVDRPSHAALRLSKKSLSSSKVLETSSREMLTALTELNVSPINLFTLRLGLSAS